MGLADIIINTINIIHSIRLNLHTLPITYNP